ncbi:MAG: hypothetical protein AAFY84_12625 [Pseudomonadota bacterium]
MGLRRDKPVQENPRPNEQGAALPIVLVFVAAASLVCAAAYRAITTSTDAAFALRQEAAAQVALTSAENEALFSYLTGQSTRRGLYFGAPFDANEAIFGDFDIATLEEGTFWRPDGGLVRASVAARRTTVPTLVELRDGTGFFSLPFASEREIAAYLTAIGIPARQSEGFAARIADYQDSDNTRRFQGAERSDYRLRQASGPSNAPLRSAEELARVLDFDPAEAAGFWRVLENTASFAPFSARLRDGYIDPRLSPLLAIQADGDIINSFSSAGPTEEQENRRRADLQDQDATAPTGEPAGKFRLVLTALTNQGAFERIVEYERTLGAPARPFNRYLVANRAANPSRGDTFPTIEQYNEYPELLQPTPAAANQ